MFTLSAAHIHVLVVHLPIVGTFFAMIPLVWGIITRKSIVQCVGLALLVVSLAGIFVAMQSGEATYSALISWQIAGEVDVATMTIAAAHYQAAEIVSKFAIFLFFLGIGQLIFWRMHHRYTYHLVILTAILNLFLMMALGYVGYLGGQIRHTEFRDTPVQITK